MSKKINWRPLAALIASALLRIIFATIRLRVIDRSGFTQKSPDFPLLITFWHNRILAISVAFLRLYPATRHGVSVLTSPSRDGDLLAMIMRYLGMGAIRGSSSRRGSRALLESADHLAQGGDLAITPDGPKGPRYHLGPGVILLAQRTDARIFPVHATISRKVEINSWDGFQIPLPFSTITLTLAPYEQLEPSVGDAEFESERGRIESILRSGAPEASQIV